MYVHVSLYIPVLDWKWSDIIIREKGELWSKRCGRRYIYQ